MPIADKSHIGSLPPQRPAFTIEQMIGIYEASDRSSDIRILKAKARELYPEVLEDGEPPLRVHRDWFGKSLEIADGEFEHQAWTLCSNLCRSVGIMKDGTPIPF